MVFVLTVPVFILFGIGNCGCTAANPGIIAKPGTAAFCMGMGIAIAFGFGTENEFWKLGFMAAKPFDMADGCIETELPWFELLILSTPRPGTPTFTEPPPTPLVTCTFARPGMPNLNVLPPGPLEMFNDVPWTIALTACIKPFKSNTGALFDARGNNSWICEKEKAIYLVWNDSDI